MDAGIYHKVKKTEDAGRLPTRSWLIVWAKALPATRMGDVYYKGEKLTFEQMEARHALCVTVAVQIKEITKTFDQVKAVREAQSRETAKTGSHQGRSDGCRQERWH